MARSICSWVSGSSRLGQMTQKQYSVYGVPGQTKPIGDLEMALTIDDFRVRSGRAHV